MPHTYRIHIAVTMALLLVTLSSRFVANAAVPAQPPLSATIVSATQDHLVLLVHTVGGTPQTVRIEAADIRAAETVSGKVRIRTQRGVQYEVPITSTTSKAATDSPEDIATTSSDPSEKLDAVLQLAQQARTEYEKMKRLHEKRMHTFLLAMEQYRSEVGSADKKGTLNTHVHRLRKSADTVQQSLVATNTTLDELEALLVQARIAVPSQKEAAHIVSLAKLLKTNEDQLRNDWQELSKLLERTYKAIVSG